MVTFSSVFRLEFSLKIKTFGAKNLLHNFFFYSIFQVWLYMGRGTSLGRLSVWDVKALRGIWDVGCLSV